MSREEERRPSYYAKFFIPLIAVLIIAAAAVFIVLQNRESSPEPGSSAEETEKYTDPNTGELRRDIFPPGIKLCGIDVSGKKPEEALAMLVDAINSYTVDIKLDGLSFPLTGQELGVRLNTEFDLNDYLEALLDERVESFIGIQPVCADEETARLALLSAYYSAREAEAPAVPETTAPVTETET